MPKHYQTKSRSRLTEELTAAEEARRNELARLVRHYAAIRLIRSPERDEAERVLGAALSHHDGPFRMDGEIWQWSRAEQSVMRHKATKPLASNHKR